MVNPNVPENDLEQIERGKRIKYIREKELKMNKSQLGPKIGVSPQFLGLVERGKGNLVYKSIRALREISGHSADYILFGLDDEVLRETNRYLQKFSEIEIIKAISSIKDIVILIKKLDN